MLGPGVVKPLSLESMKSLARFYEVKFPGSPVRLRSEIRRDAPLLNSDATFLSYIVVEGLRITPARHTALETSANGAIVQVIHRGRLCVGVVDGALVHEQQNLEDHLGIARTQTTLLHVKWFCKYDGNWTDLWAR